jgi:hypothetical protein
MNTSASKRVSQRMTTSFGLLRGCLFACSLGGVLVLPVVAAAHDTGDQLETVAECRALPPPHRGHCTECVSRARKSHYHPNAKEGERCMPADEGGKK